MEHDPYLTFLSDEDIAFHLRNHKDPSVRELSRRLAYGSSGIRGEIESLEDDLEKYEDEIGDLQDEVRALEADICEQDSLQDENDKLEEQLAHEIKRTEAFAGENRKFIAEIEHLKQVITTKKEPTMFEHQIEKLTERVAAVEKQQSTTNDLLTDILIVLREGGGDLHGPQAVKEAKEPDKETKTEYVLDDIRAAYLDLKDRTDMETAKSVVNQATGGVANITKVPEEKYAEIIAALKSRTLQEVA